MILRAKQVCSNLIKLLIIHDNHDYSSLKEISETSSKQINLVLLQIINDNEILLFRFNEGNRVSCGEFMY